MLQSVFAFLIQQTKSLFMKKYFYLFILAFVASSCSYTVYDMNRGKLDITKKETYQVEYITDIPAGTTATITYQGKDNTKYIEKLYKGKLDKTVELPSGKDVKFTVDVTLPKTQPASSLVTIIKVNGENNNSQTQTGKNVKYSFEFKLP
jgi:chromosomal replication initiation ATPase DnaA